MVRASQTSSHSSAFTIVELLIVIVVIAILATISVVAYRGIQERANISAANAKVAQAAKKIAAYSVENESYPDNLATLGLSDIEGLAYSVNNSVTPKTYCVTATVANKSSYVSSTQGSSPVQGGCPGHGQGGVAAITNWATYPNFSGNGAIATGWGAYNHGSTNAITRSVSGGVQTLTVTALNAGGRRAGVYHTRINMGENVRGKYLSARIKIDTTALASGTRARFYSDYYNGGVYTSTTSVTTASTSASEMIIGPTVINYDVTAFQPYVWIETVAGTDWFGTSTIRASELSLFITDTPLNNPAYYDGNSPNWIWNGAPNNSTSTGPAS